MMFVVNWENGYRDFLPKSWFRNETISKDATHAILSPSGETISARCTISIDRRRAAMTYSANLPITGRTRILDGRAEILFEDENRDWAIQYIWHDIDGNRFMVDVSTPEDDEYRAIEGKAVFRQHQHRERNPALRELKLASAMRPIRCEACQFDFASRYGALGIDYCEVHHRLPLSQGERASKLDDLALLCSNCHQMIHKAMRHYPDLSVNDFTVKYIYGQAEPQNIDVRRD